MIWMPLARKWVLKKGDEFSKLNGQEIKVEKLKEMIADYYANIKEGDTITVEVYRPKNKKGKYKVETLSAVAKKVKVTRKNKIGLAKNVTEKQKLTLKNWVGL